MPDCLYGQHSKLTDSSLPESVLKYYIPTFASPIQHLIPQRPSPLSNGYVLSACKNSPAPFTLLSKLQNHAKSSPVPPMAPLAIPAECMDHLAAGIDTTGDGLCFLMYHLSLPHPESQRIQSLLRQELIGSMAQEPHVPFDKLPYLDAVVKEGLRCFPPIPMSFPRYVPAGGRMISGAWIPEGTIVSCQPWTIHKDEDVFPRPLEFIPERWLEEEGKAERDRMFFAFSAGSRGCLGRQ
jgi:cytochrome P450